MFGYPFKTVSIPKPQVSALFTLLLLLSSGLLFITSCSTPEAPVPEKETGPAAKVNGKKVDFLTEVKPILVTKCVFCHNRKTLTLDKPSFETRELALKTGPKGPIIVPGKPDASRMLVVTMVDDTVDGAMPPVSHRVSKSELSTLRTWIAQGAEWPAGSEGLLVPEFIPLE